jgi:hypothetical protein
MKASERPARIAELEKEVSSLQSKVKLYQDMWMEEGKKANAGMSATLDLAKLQKQNRVIQHIAAGRTSEAILEILDPLQIMFNFKVACDRSTDEKMKGEILDKLKKEMAAHLDALQVKPVEERA